MESIVPVPGEPWRVMSAPSLPAAPKYSGASMQERRVFMRQYKTYLHALSAFETSGSRPLVIAVGNCVEERTRRLICQYQFQKDPRDVTEADWVRYFLEARKTDVQDYQFVDEAMRKLRMDAKLPDAESRVAVLVSDLHRILEELNVEFLLQEEEPTRLVGYLVDALEPAEFRAKIKARLSQERNRRYRKEPVAFVGWVTELLKSYLI